MKFSHKRSEVLKLCHWKKVAEKRAGASYLCSGIWSPFTFRIAKVWRWCSYCGLNHTLDGKPFILRDTVLACSEMEGSESGTKPQTSKRSHLHQILVAFSTWALISSKNKQPPKIKCILSDNDTPADFSKTFYSLLFSYSKVLWQHPLTPEQI